MKLVTMVRTQDGALHASADDAKRHAEKVYGEALTRLAHKAVAVQKYALMCEFIEQHLPQFVALQALSDDRQLLNEESQ